MKCDDAIVRHVPPSSDPLGESLHLLRLEGTLYCLAELSSPWAIDVPEIEQTMSFQIVTAGQCWLIVEGESPQLLTKGSLSLIPHGARHRFCDDPSTPAQNLFDLPVDILSERYEHLNFGGGGAVTQGLHGMVRFDHVAAHRLIRHLPRVLVASDWDDSEDDWLQSTLRFISREAKTLLPGGETVITRLADILVIQVIRAWLKTAAEARVGWLGALRDPHIGRALSCIHHKPAENWTVATLANEAGMSRSAFSGRFTELVGESAIQYLTTWRLQLARTYLRQGQPTIAEVVERVGYDSEAAFGRAFKRHFGESPGSVRKAGAVRAE